MTDPVFLAICFLVTLVAATIVEMRGEKND